VDSVKRRGYRFQGEATVLHEGIKFDEILNHYRKIGVKSEVKAIVLIKVDTAKEIKSPLYDLGLSEQEIETDWKKRYSS